MTTGGGLAEVIFNERHFFPIEHFLMITKWLQKLKPIKIKWNAVWELQIVVESKKMSHISTAKMFYQTYFQSHIG